MASNNSGACDAIVELAIVVIVTYLCERRTSITPNRECVQSLETKEVFRPRQSRINVIKVCLSSPFGP